MKTWCKLNPQLAVSQLSGKEKHNYQNFPSKQNKQQQKKNTNIYINRLSAWQKECTQKINK